jgi:hypothetical protein
MKNALTFIRGIFNLAVGVFCSFVLYEMVEAHNYVAAIILGIAAFANFLFAVGNLGSLFIKEEPKQKCNCKVQYCSERPEEWKK